MSWPHVHVQMYLELKIGTNYQYAQRIVPCCTPYDSTILENFLLGLVVYMFLVWHLENMVFKKLKWQIWFKKCTFLKMIRQWQKQDTKSLIHEIDLLYLYPLHSKIYILMSKAKLIEKNCVGSIVPHFLAALFEKFRETICWNFHFF